MTFSDFQKQLRKYVADDNIVGCLEALQNRVLDTAGVQDDMILAQSRYRQNEKAHNRGGISEDEYRRETARINTALLDLIATLQAKDLRDDNAQLRDALADLNLPPMPPLALVNCNREQAFVAFEQAFEQQGERPSQFYFFAGCPTQKPDSFSERIVYEVFHEVFNNNKMAVFYETVEDKLDARTVERLFIRPLPFKKLAPIESSQTLFQTTLDEIFGLYRRQLPPEYGDLTALQLANLPEHQLPIQLFTIAFRIDFAELHCSPKLCEYLRWIVTTFHQRRHRPPAFQFVFVVHASGHHHTPHPSAVELRTFIQALNAELCGGDPTAAPTCAWVEQFPPPNAESLYHWLRLRFKNNPDLPKIKKVVEQYTEHLRQSQRWNGQGGIDMADLEEFVKMAYQLSIINYKLPCIDNLENPFWPHFSPTP